MITPTEAGINFNDLNGLVDVNFINDSVSTTDITFDAVLDYGTAINPIKFSGAVSADFVLYNNTTTSTVTITVVENLPLEGNYTATFTAQTAGDSLTLSVSKGGFDGEVNVTAV
jgi:hypothetical protein